MGWGVQHVADRARRAATWRLQHAARRLRCATAAARLRPTFLIIGAQKSGTTSLHAYLADHPAVLTASVKEVEYFSRFFPRGERWYISHFPLALRGAAVRLRTRGRLAVGEASATYLFHPRAPERIHAFDPEMKLVVVLRDPVDRAYSHYQMEYRWGRETLPFEEALAREEELAPELERMIADPAYESSDAIQCSYLARGRYAEQLLRWLALFPREHLHVLTSVDLLEDPAGAVSSVAAFLDIPAWRAEKYPLRGVREYETMRPDTRERLARIFEPHNHALEELLGRSLPWTRPGALASSSSL